MKVHNSFLQCQIQVSRQPPDLPGRAVPGDHVFHKVVHHRSVELPPEVELIEEITAANIFQQVNITQDENDEVSQTTSSFMSTQQLQAPLSHIMESVLGFDSNHVIHKILLENSITTLTGFMLLDVETNKLIRNHLQ